MIVLAASGISCYDIDVVATADGKLVVGYPAHIVSELRAAGKVVPQGQLEAVPWSDYVEAGLDKRHPLLQDVLITFAQVAREEAAEASAEASEAEAEAEAEMNGAAGAAAKAGATGDAGAGLAAGEQQQQQGQSGVGGTGGGKAQEGQLPIPQEAAKQSQQGEGQKADGQLESAQKGQAGGQGTAPAGAQSQQAQQGPAQANDTGKQAGAQGQGHRRALLVLKEERGREEAQRRQEQLTRGQEQQQAGSVHRPRTDAQTAAQARGEQQQQPTVQQGDNGEQQQQLGGASIEQVSGRQAGQQGNEDNTSAAVFAASGTTGAGQRQEHGLQLQQQREEKQQQQQPGNSSGSGSSGGGQTGAGKDQVGLQGAAASGRGRSARPGPLLLIELKDRAMRVSAAGVIANASRQLDVEGLVGLWLPRVGGGLAAPVQEVGDHMHKSGSKLLKVLGLPDSRRLPNGTLAAAPVALYPEDSFQYDVFGPSIKLSDGMLAQVVKSAEGRRVVTWVVDTLEEAARVARLGGQVVVANDPLRMKDRIRLAAKACAAGALADKASSPAPSVSASSGKR